MSLSSKGPDTAADPEDGQTDGKHRADTPPSSGGEYAEADGLKAAVPSGPAKKFRIFSADSFKKLGDSLKKMSGAPASEGEDQEGKDEHVKTDKENENNNMDEEDEEEAKKEAKADIGERLREVSSQGLLSIKRMLLAKQKVYYREWAYVLSISLVLG
eukprot:1852284-Rhodomonas_salina.1